MMRLARKVGIVALLGGIAAVAPAASQQAPAAPQFRIYLSGDSSAGAGLQSVSAIVPLDGRVGLTLERPAEGADSVELVVSGFGDTQGNRLDVRIRLPGDSGDTTVTGPRRVRIGGALLPFMLAVTRPPTAEPYSGYLFVVRGKSVLARTRISLRRPPPSRLVLDRDSIVLTFGRSFVVYLREATGERPLEAVFVRLLDAQGGTADFDPERHLTFAIRGQPIADLRTQLPKDSVEAQLRRVPPGEEIPVRGTFRGLPAGNYRVKLRFLAFNSPEDPRQVVTVVVRIRDSWILPLLVLMFAILLSYFATKGVKNQHQRLQFSKRIAKERPTWLGDEPQTLPVMWARTVYRQSQDLIRRFFLSGMKVVDERLKEVAPLVVRLDRLRVLRGRIKGISEYWLRRRADKACRQIESRLRAEALDDRTAVVVDAALTDLEAWFLDDQFEARYWKHLKKDIDELVLNCAAAVSKRRDQTSLYLGKLATDLAASARQAPADVVAKIECEKDYATLKVMWERFGKPELIEDLNELIRSHQGGMWGQDLLNAADRLAWSRLKAAGDAKQVYFTSPHKDTDEPWEAYQPLLFEVQPRVPAIGDNYLFKHQGLTYEWEITLHPAPSRWRKAAESITLRPVTSEPRVIQYVPRQGTLSAKVVVRRNGRQEQFGVTLADTGDGIRTITVAESRDFRNVRAFESVEFAALLVMLTFAVVTGLSTEYLDKTGFGSLQDYFKLFLWGVGADQVKNALQMFQSPAPPGS